MTPNPITAALNDDRLSDAVTLAAAAVKASPQDVTARQLLAALAVLSGDLARAEAQASMAARLAPADAVSFGLFRQHLRGLHARRAWWQDSALPAFPGGASEADRAAIALNVALRAGDGAAVAQTSKALEALRGTRPGHWNGVAVDDLRDLDDRLPHAVEAVSAGGNYLWIDMAKIARITLRPVASPLDLALRPARVGLTDGAEADLMLPAIYPAPDTAARQLGRETDFIESHGVMIGQGQRAWLVGDDMQGFLGAELISFDDNSGGADG